MHENHRRAVAFIDVVDAQTVDIGVVRSEGIAGEVLEPAIRGTEDFHEFTVTNLRSFPP